MVEVLQEEEERQLNAAAVLGAADDTQCTYDQVRGKLHKLQLKKVVGGVPECYMTVVMCILGCCDL